jgi:hypothetical protein
MEFTFDTVKETINKFCAKDPILINFKIPNSYDKKKLIRSREEASRRYRVWKERDISIAHNYLTLSKVINCLININNKTRAERHLMDFYFKWVERF